MSIGTSLRKTAGILTTPFALVTIAALLLALIVWFVFPLLAAGEWRPFDSPLLRLSIVLAIVLVWGILAVVLRRRRTSEEDALLTSLRRQREETTASAERSDDTAKTDFALVKAHADEALSRLRRGGGFLSRAPYRLPWYLVIGPPGAGKTTALLNAGLTLPFEAPAGGATQSCDFLIADRAVFVDTAGRYSMQDTAGGVESRVWGRMLALLRKIRPRQPINGIILMLSAADLAGLHSEERVALARRMRHRLDEVTAQLRVRVPVYLLFTKLDRILGFEEFFEALGGDERADLWGHVQAPAARTVAPASFAERFAAGFDDLAQRISQRQLQRLQDEADEKRRLRIAEFPSQFARLGAELKEFVATTAEKHRFDAGPFLRGVFFTSATQSNKDIDGLAMPLAASFGRAPAELALKEMPQSERGRPYFLRRLVQDLILAEAEIGSSTGLPQLSPRVRMVLGTLACSALFVAGVVVLWLGYSESSAYTNRLVTAADDVETGIKAFKPGTREFAPFADALPVVEKLRDLSSGQAPPETVLFNTVPATDAAATAYRQGLQNLLLPYLMRNLRTGLADAAAPPATTFRELKLYLLLGQGRRPPPALIEALAPTLRLLMLPADKSGAGQERLTRLVMALTATAQDKQPLDDTIVAQARARLNTITLAKLAYDALVESAAANPVGMWRPADHMGAAGPRSLTRLSKTSLFAEIPSLFTKAGFKAQVQSGSETIAGRFAADSWVLSGRDPDTIPPGEADRIQAGMLDLYRVDCIRLWDSLLSDLAPITMTNAATAADSIGLLMGKPSPVVELLSAVASETDYAPAPLPGAAGAAQAQLASLTQALPSALNDAATAITQHYADLRKALAAPEGKDSQVDGVVQAFGGLYTQLNFVAGGGDILELGIEPQKALNQAADLVGKLPAALQPVFQRYLSQAASVTGINSSDKLAGIWATTVLPLCKSVTEQRFPFDPKAKDDAPLDDFAKLFGPTGAIAAYRERYLKPFINTSSSPWTWRGGQKLALKFNDSVLATLEQADKIRATFFVEGEKPLTRFILQPVRLDATASAFQFDTGGGVLVYANGPTADLPTQWPPTTDGAPASFSITPEIEGKRNALTAEGPWALFRLLAQGKLVFSDSGDMLVVTFSVAGRSGVTRFKLPSANNPFKPALLQSFRCPSF